MNSFVFWDIRKVKKFWPFDFPMIVKSLSSMLPASACERHMHRQVHVLTLGFITQCTADNHQVSLISLFWRIKAAELEQSKLGGDKDPRRSVLMWWWLGIFARWDRSNCSTLRYLHSCFQSLWRDVFLLASSMIDLFFPSLSTPFQLLSTCSIFLILQFPRDSAPVVVSVSLPHNI